MPTKQGKLFSTEMVSFYDRVIDGIPVNQFPKISRMPTYSRLGDPERTNIPRDGMFASRNTGFLASELQFSVMLYVYRGCTKDMQEHIAKIIAPLLEQIGFGTHISCICQDTIKMTEYAVSMQDPPIDHDMWAHAMKKPRMENIVLPEGSYKAGMLSLYRTYSPKIYVPPKSYFEYKMTFSDILMDALSATPPGLHGCVMLTLTGSRKREHM